MAKPIYTTDQIITQLTTSWGGSFTGTETWPISTITFSMSTAAPTNQGGLGVEATGLQTMTAHQQDIGRLSFRLWDDLVPLTFVESTNNANANITLNYSSTTSNDGTYEKPWGTTTGNAFSFLNAQIWMSSNWSSNASAALTTGSYGLTTFIHEIGHSLGLSHPGLYNAGGGRTITYATNAVFDQDNRHFSLMSYFGGYNTVTKSWTQDGTNSSWLYPQTPMVYDIAAIQFRYGADMTTRTGNNVYGYNSTFAVGDTERAIYDFSVNANPIFSIWDAGGNDTIDASLYDAGAQTINLAPGSYSSLNGMVDNVGIAFNCIIENAIGGSGNDLIIGNAAANQLQGGAGSDQMIGGAGDDRLYGQDGADTIWGETGNDQLVGGIGDDQLYGQEGSDTLWGEDGNDLVDGGAGSDTIYGQNGDDRLFGGDGVDKIYGGTGNDQIVGGNGDDEMYGETLNDTLWGEDGNDFIDGGTGDDTLFGQNGQDFLLGGAGFDNLTGGAGADVFYFSSQTNGTDRIYDFSSSEGDRIALLGSAFSMPAGFQFTAGVGFFSGAGAHPLAQTATIYYDTNTRALWFDADGTGAGGANVLAFLLNTPTLTAGSFVVV